MLKSIELEDGKFVAIPVVAWQAIVAILGIGLSGSAAWWAWATWSLFGLTTAVATIDARLAESERHRVLQAAKLDENTAKVQVLTATGLTVNDVRAIIAPQETRLDRIEDKLDELIKVRSGTTAARPPGM